MSQNMQMRCCTVCMRANPAQRDLFLNEAEGLAPNAAAVAEEATPEAVEVAGQEAFLD